MRGGPLARVQRALPIVLVLALVVPGFGSDTGSAHRGQGETVSAAGVLEAEAYDFPDPGCDPHPAQQLHRHTHTEIGETPPVGTGVWLPWRGCWIDFWDIHFDRGFAFDTVVAEQLHDSLPWYNPWWTTITHSVHVNGALNAKGTSRSDYFQIQYPPPEDIPLESLGKVPRGTYDIRLRVDLNHDSEQNYFVDKLRGTFDPDTPPADGPCANAPILPPAGLIHNGMRGDAAWPGRSYAFRFASPAHDPEGDPLTYTWEWADAPATATTKRYTSHTFTGVRDQAFTVRITDDPSDRCTNTPTQTTIAGPFPFRTLPDFVPRITLPVPGQICHTLGYQEVGHNAVVGSCTVHAEVATGGSPATVEAVRMGVRFPNGVYAEPFASDAVAPYAATFSSWTKLPGPGYSFYVCTNGADDIYAREFCRTGYSFTNT